jgi:hypothetical protein
VLTDGHFDAVTVHALIYLAAYKTRHFRRASDPVQVISVMTPTSALVAFILLGVATAFHVPGCLPDEDVTILSAPVFPVIDPTTETFTNLTITYFTCPSRQAQASERQSQTSIELCGIMESGQVFDSKLVGSVPRPAPGLLFIHCNLLGTFTCDQVLGDQPTFNDCDNFDAGVVDSAFHLTI